MKNELLISRIVAKTNEYLDAPSVVGHEAPFLDHLTRDFRAAGLTVTRQRNLAIIDTGQPGPIFFAHIDRHGAVMDENGTARFAAYAVKSDKYNETVAPSPEFADRLDERFRGETMYAYDRRTGGRLAYAVIERVTLHETLPQLVFRFDAMPPLPAGTPVAFARQQARETGSTVSGQLDNPLSAAMLRVLTETGLRGRIVFAAEEEIGRSAAHILSWMSANVGAWNRCIVVDTTPFDDTSALDGGVVILRTRDAHAPFDAALTAAAEAAATRLALPFAYKDRIIDGQNAEARVQGRPEKGLGMTELGRMITLSGGEVTGTTVQVPTTGYHTNHETTSRRAIRNAARLLLELSRTV